ncbi:uncharacterized protein LOC110435007 isoform X1 [Sorghum bicolor]|uniref:uncharacterized protein LOC110435007 isoform X1 n=1 Tax=Sorghum bicolor TaxID=4558 RepID=UPI000B4261B0|nr:uncharacterized protein LOC110435007 isoform X1 [Sorghum bicolor]|eukprot:XP_021315899.1 uncharacterized protein LOC110435007 isoform X1 [Sorghum bicolor]
MCKMDEDLYLMRCPLICFYAVEWHLPHRVARQFGLKQQFPIEPFSTSIDLHKIDRQKQKKETDFESLHRHYIDQWENVHENIYENDEPHTNDNFRAYLTWYRGATRTKLKVQWTQADYADITSSDEEQTSYDLATREGTQVECAPILDRVGNSLNKSVVEIERFPRTGVDQNTINTFLTRLARRLRRAARRCGCGTSTAIDIHEPHAQQWERWPSSISAPGGSRGQSSSTGTVDTFQVNRLQDDEEQDEETEDHGYDELSDSEIPDAPTDQATQGAETRRRHPPSKYTPGTGALGHKGKGKRRRR